MSIFSRLVQRPVDFVESKVEEAKGEVRKEIANGMASVTMIIVLAVTSLIVIFFISAGAALLMNSYLGNRYIGFFVVGAFYLASLGLVFYLRHNKPFMDRLRRRYRHEFGVPDETEVGRIMRMEEEEDDDDDIYENQAV